EVAGQTSTYEEHAEETINAARTTYACPNVLTRYRFVRMHTNTPTSMRAPGHVSGAFALECAMDELAVQLGMDPMQLRILNHADRNEADDLPWSSKELLACYRTAAERFGWGERSWQPRALRDGGPPPPPGRRGPAAAAPTGPRTPRHCAAAGSTTSRPAPTPSPATRASASRRTHSAPSSSRCASTRPSA